MEHQLESEYAGKRKTTCRVKFLAEMEITVSSDELLVEIKPYQPNRKRGHPPIGLERMLRLYFPQQ
jgi:IS5 family transposase